MTVDEKRMPKGRVLPGVMTADEVAEYFGVSAQSARIWGRRGLLKHSLVVNGQHFYSEADVAVFEPPRDRRRRLLSKAMAMIASGEIQ